MFLKIVRLFLLLSIILRQFVCELSNRSPRIVGGYQYLQYQHPWAAALKKNDALYCGATIISRNYLLTAAHCIYNFLPEEIQVYIGLHKLEDHCEIKSIRSTVHHEQFDVVSFNNDIGLIRIALPMIYGAKVQPAGLPKQKGSIHFGELGIVSGWGRMGENKQMSNVIKYISVPIWSDLNCSQSGYGSKRITENMLCAGYIDGLMDACQGDSGGSMLRKLSSGKLEIIGIISWGRGCARPNFPGIYTKVTNYRNWIDQYSSSDSNEKLQLPKF